MVQSTGLFVVTQYSCSQIAKTMQKCQDFVVVVVVVLATVIWKLVPNSYLNLKTKGHTGPCDLKDGALDFIVPQNKYG